MRTLVIIYLLLILGCKTRKESTICDLVTYVQYIEPVSGEIWVEYSQIEYLLDSICKRQIPDSVITFHPFNKYWRSKDTTWVSTDTGLVKLIIIK